MRILNVMLIWTMAVLLGSSSASALVTFERAYGGAANDVGYFVRQTWDGGYIITGQTVSFGAGNWDVYLVKTDASGDTLWTRTYGGTDWDSGHSVQQTSDGGYIIAGWTWSFGAGDRDVYLVKTDASGDTEWTRTYGGMYDDMGRSAQQTHDGGYIMTGHTRSFGAGDRDVYLIKTDASGDTLWTRTYGHPHKEEGRSVQQTPDGGYIVAGWTNAGLGLTNAYLIKTDSLGDTLWTRTYGGIDYDMAFSVQQTQDGGYIIAGETWSFGAGSGDVYLVKTDASGDAEWVRAYGGWNWDFGYSVQQTEDGGYVVAGLTWSFGPGVSCGYLIKTDGSGDVWVERLVTGGGWIPGDGPGEKRTFGFNAHSQGGSGWGQLQFNDHALKMRVHSDTIKAAVIQPGDTIANFSGDCRVDGVSGFTFDCEVMDRGEPAHYVDKFSIDIHDGAGSLYYSAGDFLGGGNIQIHALAERELAESESNSQVGPGGDWDLLLRMADGRQVGLMGQRLGQNQPNPFTRSTVITYCLPPRRGDAEMRREGDSSTYQRINLSIYDLSGRLVKVLVDEPFDNPTIQPWNSVSWDGRDNSGRNVPSGVYLYRLTAGGDFTATKKLVLLR